MAETRRYRGLLIGNATFPRDPHALPALDGPRDDIKQLRKALTDPQIGLFDPADLEAVRDGDIQELRDKVDELFTTATRGDVLLLYYSGHGELDERGTLYLCAKDTRTASLRATALSAIEINNIIEGSPATSTVIILDCCYSGAFKSSASSTHIAGRGRYVLTSSRSTQLARAADHPGQPSPFTGHLVRALRVAQPGKGIRHLTVVEIYRQVHDWMTANAAIAPQLRFVGEGDVILARRPPPSPRKTDPPSTAEPAAGAAAQQTPDSAGQPFDSQSTSRGDHSDTPAPARTSIPRRTALTLGASVLVGGAATAFPLLKGSRGNPEGSARKGVVVLDFPKKYMQVAFSPDGKVLAAVGQDEARLWDVATEKPIANLHNLLHDFGSMVFIPDGKALVSRIGENPAKLVDVATGKPLITFTKEREEFWQLALSPKGNILATCDGGNNVWLWDVATRTPLGSPLADGNGQVRSMAFSPDGKTLVTGAMRGVVQLWDVASRTPLGSPLTGHTGDLYSVAFSRDGRTLATGSEDKTARLWDAVTRTPLGSPLDEHTGHVFSVALSRDGKTLATGSEDKTARLWDVASRTPLGPPLTGHTDAVTAVAFSRDGKTLATGGDDKTVRLWPVS